MTLRPRSGEWRCSDALVENIAGRARPCRFEWLAQRAAIIPLEVILTRIRWGGRQIIQAVINDISERKRAEAELLRSLAREGTGPTRAASFPWCRMVSHAARHHPVVGGNPRRLPGPARSGGSAHNDSIARNTRRMAHLMEVLVLGRLDAGKMDFRPAALAADVLPAHCG